MIHVSGFDTEGEIYMYNVHVTDDVPPQPKILYQTPIYLISWGYFTNLYVIYWLYELVQY